MAERPHEEDPFEKARRAVEAARAEHEARMAAAKRAHDERMVEVRQQMEAARQAHLARMETTHRRLEEGLAGKRRPPGRRKPRDEEGGEPVPAVPKPRPSPLSGADAATIE
jgi:hypothetical protein